MEQTQFLAIFINIGPIWVK